MRKTMIILFLFVLSAHAKIQYTAEEIFHKIKNRSDQITHVSYSIETDGYLMPISNNRQKINDSNNMRRSSKRKNDIASPKITFGGTLTTICCDEENFINYTGKHKSNEIFYIYIQHQGLGIQYDVGTNRISIVDIETKANRYLTHIFDYDYVLYNHKHKIMSLEEIDNEYLKLNIKLSDTNYHNLIISKNDLSKPVRYIQNLIGTSRSSRIVFEYKNFKEYDNISLPTMIIQKTYQNNQKLNSMNLKSQCEIKLVDYKKLNDDFHTYLNIRVPAGTVLYDKRNQSNDRYTIHSNKMQAIPLMQWIKANLETD
ncbi:hypothetical protein GF373_04720 [bacterium]|nr:hypothetical protein [bacterium]